MKIDIDKIIACLNYLKIEIKNPINNYNERFFLQKFSYLIKSMGFPLSYEDTNLYVKGPYSPQLTQDYYCYDGLFQSNNSSYIIQEKDREILKMYQENIMKHPKYYEKQFELLESISTINYLIEFNNLEKDQEIRSFINMIKPYLSEKTITIGLNIVKKIRFKPEFLTDDLKSEIDLWDKARD